MNFFERTKDLGSSNMIPLPASNLSLNDAIGKIGDLLAVINGQVAYGDTVVLYADAPSGSGPMQLHFENLGSFAIEQKDFNALIDRLNQLTYSSKFIRLLRDE